MHEIRNRNIKQQLSCECEGGFGSPHARLGHLLSQFRPTAGQETDMFLGWPNVMPVVTAELKQYKVTGSHCWSERMTPLSELKLR